MPCLFTYQDSLRYRNWFLMAGQKLNVHTRWCTDRRAQSATDMGFNNPRNSYKLELFPLRKHWKQHPNKYINWHLYISTLIMLHQIHFYRLLFNYHYIIYYDCVYVPVYYGDTKTLNNGIKMSLKSFHIGFYIRYMYILWRPFPTWSWLVVTDTSLTLPWRQGWMVYL